MDNTVNDFLLSMRNMGFPMLPMRCQHIFRILVRLGFFNLDGIVWIDDGIIHTYAGQFGDIWLARKEAEKLRKSWEPTFFVPSELMKAARRMLYSFQDTPIRLTDDFPGREFLISIPVPAVILCVPGIAVEVPEPARFALWKTALGKANKTRTYADNDLVQKILSHLAIDAKNSDLQEEYIQFQATLSSGHSAFGGP